MRMNKEARLKQAIQKVLFETNMDYIIDVYEMPDFIEVHGRSGREDVCFRVYNNGKIYER